MKKIVVTGGTSRFATVLKKIKTKHKLFFPSKKEFDITNENTIKKYLKKKKTKYSYSSGRSFTTHENSQ